MSMSSTPETYRSPAHREGWVMRMRMMKTAIAAGAAVALLVSGTAFASDDAPQTVTIEVREQARTLTLSRVGDVGEPTTDFGFSTTMGASTSMFDTNTLLAFTNSAAEARIVITRDATDLQGLALNVQLTGAPAPNNPDFSLLPFQRPERDTEGQQNADPAMTIGLTGTATASTFFDTPINDAPPGALVFAIEPGATHDPELTRVSWNLSGTAPTGAAAITISTTFTYVIEDDTAPQ
jgi:hypothetical protein